MSAELPWVELVRVRDAARIGLLRSLLESAEIEHLVEGEQVQGLFPMSSPGFFLDRGLGVVLRVRPEDLDDARRLIEEQVEAPGEADGEAAGDD